MQRHSVASSSIESVGYDPVTSRLEIQFAESGELYEYFMVPPSLFGRMMKADSKGRFFAEFVRDKFQFRQI